MLKQLFVVLSLGLILSISSAEPTTEIVTGQMRGYHGAGKSRSVEDLRNEKSPLNRERAINRTATTGNTVVTPIQNPVVTPIAPTSTSTPKPTTTSPIKPTTSSPITPTTK